MSQIAAHLRARSNVNSTTYDGTKVAISGLSLCSSGGEPNHQQLLLSGGFTLKLRIATLLLTILCLALSAARLRQVRIFSEGPIDGNDNAFFITGPNNPNFLGSFQDISNGFIAAISGYPQLALSSVCGLAPD